MQDKAWIRSASSPVSAAGAQMNEIADASTYDEDDGSLQEFKEGNDENPKVEKGNDKVPKVGAGYDDGNAQEVPISNENVLFGDSKVSTTVEIFSNGSPCKDDMDYAAILNVNTANFQCNSRAAYNSMPFACWNCERTFRTWLFKSP